MTEKQEALLGAVAITDQEREALNEAVAAGPVLEANAIIMLAFNPADGSLYVQMGVSHGGEPDLGNPAEHMMAWMAQNWETFVTMFSIARTKYVESLNTPVESEAPAIIEPQGLKLVAADGQSLVQQ